MPDAPIAPARRVGRRIGVGALALVLVAATGATAFGLTIPQDRLDTVWPRALHVSEDASGSWQAGDLEVVIDEHGLVVRDNARVVWTSAPDTAFVTAGRGAVAWQEHRGYFWPDVEYDAELDGQQVDRVDAGQDHVVVRGRVYGDGEVAPYTLTVRDGGQDKATLSVDAEDVTSVALVSGRSNGAGVHGFGEQFTDFDLDDRLLPIVVREQGVGRGKQPLSFLADLTNHGAGGTEQMTYAAWASYVTTDLRALRLDPGAQSSHAFAVADTRAPDRVSLELWSPNLVAEVTAADSPTKLVAAQQQGTRRPRLAPWATDGAIVGLQGGTDEVREELETLRDADAEISAVWIQDWTGQRTTSFGERLWWTWQLDTERYPGWSELVAQLRAEGIRTTTYVNPWLVDAEPKGDPSIRNLWEEARELGYLVGAPNGGPYQLDQGGYSASLVDLTDPAARSWFADVIAEEVLAAGVDGFMADFGEGLPFDAEIATGEAATRHNEWPALWAQTVRAACERAGRPDCVTWFRTGALGQAEWASLFWTGDQLVSYDAKDGLASALLATFSAGVSGWPLVHSDVGGYTSVDAVVKDYVRTPELLRRWAEYEAFGVVMRTHESNRPDANAQVFDSPESAAAFARMTRLHAALQPYRRGVVREATRTGVPALRHGWLVAPGTAAAESDTQFFLGEDLLVAPVLEKRVETVEVTFPPGTWVHLLTGERYAGDRTIDVAAPLGSPAAFVRADSPWAERLPQRVQRAVEGG